MPKLIRALAPRGWILAGLAGVLLLSITLLRPGLAETSDGEIHLLRSVEYVSLLKQGILYPTWAPNMYFGQGSPIFLYVPPLYHYLASSLLLAGLDVEVATKVLIVLILLVSFAGSFLFLREWFPADAALVGALCFLLAPFRVREVYYQGDFPQLLAIGFLPLWLWLLRRAIATNALRFWAGTVLCLAMLLTSHNITALFHVPVGVAYALYMVFRKRPTWANMGRVAGVGLSALLLTAFFWLPIAGMINDVQVNRNRSNDYNPALHLLSLREMLAPSIAIDAAAVVPEYPHNLGMVQVLLALPSLAGLARRRNRVLVAGSWAALAGCMFFMLPPSAFIWEQASFFRFIEFPWRLLALCAFPLSILGAASVSLLRGKAGSAAAIVASLALMLSTMVQLYPATPFISYAHLSPLDIAEFELRTGAIGTTSSAEYTPATVQVLDRPQENLAAYQQGETPRRFDMHSLPGGATAVSQAGPAQSYSFRINSPVGFDAHLFVADFPGWAATVDGIAVPITHDERGQMYVAVPQGEHLLVVRYAPTALQRVAMCISAGALAVLLGVGTVLFARRRGWRQAGEDREGGPQAVRTEEAVPLAPGLVACAFVLLAVARVTFVDSHTHWFRARSSLDALRGVTNMPVDFGPQEMRLLGFRLQGEGPYHAGDAVTLSLYWQRLGKEGDLHSSVQLLDEGGAPLAGSDHVHPGGVPVRYWQLNHYCRDDHILVLPRDLPPDSYRLIAKLYGASGGGAMNTSPGNRPWATIPIVVEVGLPADGAQAAVEFGQELVLSGYDLRPAEAGRYTLVLKWDVQRAPTASWTVFLQLLDAQGRYITGYDGLPFDGVYPTSAWPAGAHLEELRSLQVPADLPAGSYQLAIGLYDAATGQRVPCGLPGDALMVPWAVR